MTYPGSSSAETYQASIPADANSASNPPDAFSKPTPQAGAATKVRQDPIQSPEKLASSNHPLVELLENAKQLIDPSTNPEPNVTASGESDINETAGLTEIGQETSGGRLHRQTETANRFRRSGHNTQIWRRARLQVMAALAAAVVGCGFGYEVAGNDLAMRVLFAAAVTMGLFFAFSAFATQLNQRRERRY